MLPCLWAMPFLHSRQDVTLDVAGFHERAYEWPFRRFDPIQGGEGDAQIAREGRLPGSVFLTQAGRLHDAAGLQRSWAPDRTGTEIGMRTSTVQGSGDATR